jgi:tRNA A-37 threonylcarbamoyl transferase component Bud32/tetratricopeptide (TPR) repeat protein
LELPGFQVQAEIGHGATSRVYLAMHKQLSRLVALKILAEEYGNDPAFRVRFLNESRIGSSLSHPNIVQVYDTGAHDNTLYLVLEYVRGGNLLQRVDRGMHIRDLVRVVQNIGKALDYAHARGLVHRDVKPENILFREDGSAVLTDFGIAGFVDPDGPPAKGGTVPGTPQYMSPEQAAGKALDGRSDLYSLGIVFFRVLTGDVPYKADTAVSLGIKHLQEPIPRLPNHLAIFQDVVNRSLAKKPDQRFQSGQEFADALETLAASGQVPSLMIKARAVAPEEIRSLGSNVFARARDSGRGERQSAPERRPLTLGRAALAASLVAAVLAFGIVVVEQPQWFTRMLAVTGIAEDPEVEDAWSNAQSLHQDPNQSLATIVAGYRRVVNLDPDHEGARAAIAGLASQWKSSIEDSLAAENLEQAGTKLEESLTVFPEDPSLVELTEQLTNRQHAESLLASTQALLRSHGLSDIPSATAAIQAYQEVLRLAPDHAVATEELNSLAQHYASLAAEAADTGEVDAAISFLDRASAANSELRELDLVRSKIQQATTLQAAIIELLQQASAYRAAGALINPPGENAAELYHRVLATYPENVIATQGLDEVVSQLRGTANQLLAAGDLGALQELVDRSSAVGLDPVAVNEMKSSLETEIARRATVAERLDQARGLLAEGFITEPQGRNVVALLREVERLDPGNEPAKRMLKESAERLASVAQEAYEVGMVDDAKHYLELALTVTPDVAAWRELRATWEKSVASN